MRASIDPAGGALPPLVSPLRGISRGAVERQPLDVVPGGRAESTLQLGEMRRLFEFSGFRCPTGAGSRNHADASPQVDVGKEMQESPTPLDSPEASHGGPRRMVFDDVSSALPHTGSVAAQIGEIQPTPQLDLVAAAKEFRVMVEEVEAALAGGKALIKQLRRGETKEDKVQARTAKHYKIPLPTRPSKVTVFIEPRSGDFDPELWGSTSHDRPDSLHSEVKGDGLQLIYDHCLPPMRHEEGEAIDRRTAVPPCTELYVTVEGKGNRLAGDQASECTYRIHFSVRPLAVVLSRQELRSQVEKMRTHWRARLEYLRKDDHTRHKFNEDVQQHQYNIKMARRQLWGTLDCVERNRKVASQASLRFKLNRIEREALRRIARHDAASLRRQGLSTSEADDSSSSEQECIKLPSINSIDGGEKCPQVSRGLGDEGDGPSMSALASLNRAVFSGVNVRGRKRGDTD